MIIHKVLSSLVLTRQLVTVQIPLIPVFCALLLLFFYSGTAKVSNAQQIPTPRSVLGFNPTDDKTIADWKQITDYFAKLDAASDRVSVRQIGKSTLGKPQIAAFISSSANIKNLEQIRRISSAIANPGKNPVSEGVDPLEIGKTIVAISCSIHSTEIVASQMSMLLAYELATSADALTREILDNTVLILIPSANPDGIDIVADWYRKTLGTEYEGSSPPELYNHYAGHDNNRDWFMLNLQETRNITKLFWQDWFPQIVFDVHQQGQSGARFTIPPFFDPPNPRISPSILRELGLLGYKMAADLQMTGQAGIVTNATYDTWWHGGFRSAPYYHNAIGILSEAASADLMSPIIVKRDRLERQNPSRGLKSPLERLTNNPLPWQGGEWKPSDIARIEMIASRSVLEMAAKFRTRYLQMTRNLALANLRPEPGEPKAFIVYAGQPNEERVARMLEILMWQGMEIFELTREIEAALDESDPSKFGEIPAGSFLVFVNQPQRPNVLSLFENQVYPERINETGEAESPYDVAGWTLPLQMGIDYAAAWEIKDFERLSVNSKGRSKYLRRVVDHNQARKVLNLNANKKPFENLSNPLKSNPKVGLYKGWANSMDEGWTRLVLDSHQIRYTSLMDQDFRSNNLDYDVIILPSIDERFLVSGRSEKQYPKEYSGGITETGISNLKSFVENGGRLICFDDSCELVINRFSLPMKNALKGKSRKEFHCPGSILKIDVDRRFSLARGLNREAAAYFIYSSAFEITDKDKVKSVAKYAEKDVLLSGWIFGEEHLVGKTAIAETDFRKGKIVLFAFRPQHRGQTFGTFPFVFNALEK